MFNDLCTPPELNARNRLPIHHPDYCYPSSKNPYWTKLKEYSHQVYSDNATESQKGTWSSRFCGKAGASASSGKLHVEIGCNAGHVILEWAAKKKDHDFIGIDWKFKPIFRAADKARGRGIDNLIFLRAHAERLQFMFGPNEIDHLYLFFPDPWPKKSQWKNRFVNESRLREIAPVMNPGGIFHIKTDHPAYFEWMLEAVSHVSDLWEITEMTRDLHQGHPNPQQLKIPDVTLFESLFIKDGIKIQSIKLKRLNTKAT